MSAVADLLARASWRLTSSPAGQWQHPWEVDWSQARPAVVPGGVAASVGAEEMTGVDSRDWWFATDVDAPARLPMRLEFDGVATWWTAWWDEREVAHGASAFRPVQTEIEVAPGRHRLVLRCTGLDAVTVPRKPRAPWRSPHLDNRYRWFRTPALGRIAWPGAVPPVGPWLPVRLVPQLAADVLDVRTDISGRVVVTAEARRTCDLALTVGEVSAAAVLPAGRHTLEVQVPEPRLWWPHGYGPATSYPLTVHADGEPILERPIGFATIERAGSGLRVNGTEVFARGFCWMPVDPAQPGGSAEDDARALRLLQAAGANTIRILGTTTYLPPHFHRLCVELGLMVWHDIMLHSLPPVEDEAWLAELDAEVRAQLGQLQGMPHLAVVSGGTETEQQAVMWGLPSGSGRTTAIDTTVPAAVADLLPGTVHVSSTPSGGWRPMATAAGFAHYDGVGPQRLPLSDARTSGVEFAAQCLAFGLVPERPLVRQRFGTHTTRDDADWVAAIARDPGIVRRDDGGAAMDEDHEHITAHYAHELFDVDIDAIRRADPERALDLLRATAVQVFSSVATELRRPGSGCHGMIVRAARDLTAGAGWGVVDAAGGRKSAWWALRRAWQPRAALLTDEGADSIAIHLVNDLPEPWADTLSLQVSDPSGRCETVLHDVEVPGHGALTLWAEALLDGFRDLNHVWRLEPRTCDAVTVTIGRQATCMLMPTRLRAAGQPGSGPADGPQAVWSTTPDGHLLELGCDQTHAFVAIESSSHTPSDNWFHIGGGTTRRIWFAGDPGRRVEGTIRCLDGGGDEWPLS